MMKIRTNDPPLIKICDCKQIELTNLSTEKDVTLSMRCPDCGSTKISVSGILHVYPNGEAGDARLTCVDCGTRLSPPADNVREG